MTLAAPTTDTARATPAGPPDDRDRDKWLLLALLFVFDLGEADSLWQAHAPPRFANLLNGRGGYTFNPATGTYTSPGGSAVSAMALKRITLGVALSVEHELEDAAAEMAAGSVPLAEWQVQTAETLRSLYAAFASVAHGGNASTTQADLDAVSTGGAELADAEPPTLAFTLDRLYSFAAEIASARDTCPVDEPLPQYVPASVATTPAITNRAGLYASSANGVYEGAKRRQAMGLEREPGLKLWERSILTDGADHCADGEFTEGCIGVAEAGWQEAGSLPLPGLRTCMCACLCAMEYRVFPEDVDPNAP